MGKCSEIGGMVLGDMNMRLRGAVWCVCVCECSLRGLQKWRQITGQYEGMSYILGLNNAHFPVFDETKV